MVPSRQIGKNLQSCGQRGYVRIVYRPQDLGTYTPITAEAEKGESKQQDNNWPHLYTPLPADFLQLLSKVQARHSRLLARGKA
jgi:hypothetical protein